MTGGAGMWLILGVLVLVMTIAAVRSIGQRDDFDEQDIEHLDHQIHGDKPCS